MSRTASMVAGMAAAMAVLVAASAAVNTTANKTSEEFSWEAELERINSLEFLVPYWEYMINNYSEFTINAGFTFVLHQIVYFGTWAPYIILDFIPYFHKYKIQANKPNTWDDTWKCLKYIFFNQVFVQLPMIISSDHTLKMLGFGMQTPLPSLFTIFWKVLVSAILEDFYNYWAHRFLHWKRIYKYIHKVHHEYAAPFGITAEYAHPAETLILGVGTFLGPFLLTRHLLTLWVWMSVRIIQSIDSHCGYELPWSLTRVLPFWGGAVHHDYHHEKFDVNYASFFTVWDYVFGTDVSFREAQHAKVLAGESHWSDFFYKIGVATYVKDDAKKGNKKAKVA
ncbi:Methylsterol monooxygenase 1 [Aphanomyces cochlioides]|nr:Methylsterol monooxygenase 1 [Aphanomyces cochlioides]